jgi:hypothetical protein
LKPVLIGRLALAEVWLSVRVKQRTQRVFLAPQAGLARWHRSVNSLGVDPSAGQKKLLFSATYIRLLHSLLTEGQPEPVLLEALKKHQG